MFPDATRQLSLDFSRTHRAVGLLSHDLSVADVIAVQQKRIASYLSMMLQDEVEVIFTDNRATMISFKKKSGVLKLRLHKMFQQADDTILKALWVFIRGIPSIRASKKLDDFIKSNQGQIRIRTKPRRHAVQPVGEHFNLQDILDRVSSRYFAGETEGVCIGWGRYRQRRARRTRTRSRALATYCFEDQTIRVNPVMDTPRVPDFVIDWVVYHELLHHVLPVEKSGGRKRYHTSRFRTLERAFPSYLEARKWEQQNLDWLLK